MKKILVFAVIMAMSVGLAVQADEPDTYSGLLMQKYTQKITDTEKELRDRHEAREQAILEQRQKRNESIQYKLQQIEEQKKQRDEANAKKIQEIEKQRQEQRDAMNKKVEEFNNQNAAAKKQSADASKARQQRIERKKQLWNELISK